MTAVLEKTDRRTKQAAFVARYFGDPIGFQCDCLDTPREMVWGKMREVAESVRDYQKTAVFAGHGVSKTYEAARIALWWLYTHIPSTVITTAPVYDQVEKLLWKEIHRAHSHAHIPLGGNMTKTQLDVDPNNKWFAYGFATKPDTVTGEATRMQGYHNKYVLIIFDEAAGIVTQIWKATESLLNSENCHMLAIGNPTAAEGTFASLEEDPTWHFIRISVKDTPNYKTGEEIIPEISGRSYEEMMRKKYGEESTEYGIRVEGRKPAFSEGTYLGAWIAQAEKDGRIGATVYDPSLPVLSIWDNGDMYTAIWFAQLTGKWIDLIDFEYDALGKGLPYFAGLLKQKGYKYGGHYAPPDLWGSNKGSFQTGQFTVDVARSLGIDFEMIIPGSSREDRIEAARSIMPVCRFGPKTAEGVAGLKDWRKRKNEALSTPDRPVWFEEALKTWGRHVGDAFSHLGLLYRYMEVPQPGGREVVGSLRHEQRPANRQVETSYDYSPWEV
jgi:hypothetical protein